MTKRKRLSRTEWLVEKTTPPPPAQMAAITEEHRKIFEIAFKEGEGRQMTGLENDIYKLALLTGFNHCAMHVRGMGRYYLEQCAAGQKSQSEENDGGK